MRKFSALLGVVAMTVSLLFTGCKMPHIEITFDDESESEVVSSEETVSSEEETEEEIPVFVEETEEAIEETEEEPEEDELVLIATGREYLYQFESGETSDSPSGYALLQVPVIVSDGYDKLEMTMQSLTAEQKKAVDAFMGEIKEAQAAGEVGTKYSWEQEAIVYRADHELFSVLYKVDTMYGKAAHPNTQYHAWNISPVTGEQIPVSMLVNDLSQLTDAIILAVDNLYEDDYLFPEWRDKIASGLADGAIAVTLSEAGVEVVINQNAIAAYALGETFLTLSYEDYPTLVRSEYFHEDFLKVQKLRAIDVIEKDLNGDGYSEYLNATVYVNEGDATGKGLRVYYGTSNETAVVYDTGYFFDIDSVYLVEPEKDHYFLLCNVKEINDDGGMLVMDLQHPDQGASLVEDFRGGKLLGTIEKPNEFNMSSHIYCLGSYDSVVVSRMESDGLIFPYYAYRIYVPEEASVYDSSYGLPSKSFRKDRLLTLKKDLECQVYDYNEGILDTTVTLSAGTICYPYLSDNSSVVIIGTMDGGFYYIKVDEWMINGEPESDYFDNLMYAG